MTRKRVLFVCPDVERSGGIGRLNGYLFAAWAAQDDAPDYRVLVTRGWGGVYLSPIYLIGVAAMVIFEWLTGRARLLHVHSSYRASIFRKACIVLLGSMLRLPIILHLHGGGFPEFYARLPKFAQRIVLAAFRRADRVIVLGRPSYTFVTGVLGIAPEQVLILHNAVPAPADIEVSPRAVPRIVYLGDLLPRKGVPELLAAFADASVRRLAWEAVLAGNSDVDGCARRAAQLGLGDRVKLPGWIDRPEVAALLAGADIFVLPSHLEDQPMSMLEAMAHGLAIVVTPVGSVPDVVIDGEDGLLVPVGDAVALAAALAELLGDSSLRRRLGQAARRRFMRDAEIGGYAKRLAQIYAELTGEADDETVAPRARP